MTDNYSNETDAGLRPQPTHYGFDRASGADKSYTLPAYEDLHDRDGFIYDEKEGFLPVKYGQATPPPKHWYESKTIWFNAIVIAVGLASSATPALEQYMSAEMYGVIASFVAFINAILRLATGQPIKGGK